MNFKIQNLKKDQYWVDEFIKNGNQVNFVNGILPNLYTKYFKLFLPVGLKNKNGILEQIRYKELAEKAELKFNKSFSFTNLVKKYGGLPSNFEILKAEDVKFINELINILGASESTIFEGYGDDVVAEEFQQSWTIEDKLDKFQEIFNHLNFDNYHDYNHFPNLIYPQNRNWCIATIIFQSGILVMGCDNFIAEKIKAQNIIDYDEIDYNDEYFEFIKQ